MTKLTDGKRTVGITMNIWTGSGYTSDWSNDFFDVGCIEYDDKAEAYRVKDVEYCIEQAMHWKNKAGDFEDDSPIPSEDRNVVIESL